MKKIIEFIKDDPVMFLIILGVIALVIALGLPVIVFLARLFWTFALSPIVR